MALEFESDRPLKSVYGMVPCTCCNKLVPGKITFWPDQKESRPINRGCKSCEKWLGHLEEDCFDELAGMCIECFKEETDQ